MEDLQKIKTSVNELLSQTHNHYLTSRTARQNLLANRKEACETAYETYKNSDETTGWVYMRRWNTERH
jgi:hypothetical protein